MPVRPRLALANPAEHALIFGSPVPGCRAPTDTIAAATRTPTVLIGVAKDGYDSGALPRPRRRPAGRRPRRLAVPDVPETLLARGMQGWTQLFGTLSCELFGQFANVVDARESYFDHQVRRTAEMIGFHG